MQIKAILECFNSKRDLNGNRYFAFSYTDTTTGAQAHGTISGGESNVSCIVREMGLDWPQVRYTQTELGIREFNRLTKPWKYAGCPSRELAAFIRSQLAEPVTA